MAFYHIVQGTAGERENIRCRLSGLDELSPEAGEKVITAWVTSWKSGNFENMDDASFMEHVREVVRCGIKFARASIEEWGEEWKKKFDWQELIQVLILHDVDKPIIFNKPDAPFEKYLIATQIPHGVLGAMILHDIGFSNNVVSAVATHSPGSSMHPGTAISYILHYADMFCTDHEYLLKGTQAFFQKRVS